VAEYHQAELKKLSALRALLYRNPMTTRRSTKRWLCAPESANLSSISRTKSAGRSRRFRLNSGRSVHRGLQAVAQMKGFDGIIGNPRGKDSTDRKDSPNCYRTNRSSAKWVWTARRHKCLNRN